MLDGAPGRNFWWVSPIFAQAKVVFRRCKRRIPRELYTKNESEMTLELSNGATIWFKSGENPDSLYGDDVYAAVIDEASRIREESWHAIRTTLTATRGPVRIIGNVKGRKNWFWKLCRLAESGEPGMHYGKITADMAVAAGVLDAAEIEDARRKLPPHVFKQLYEAEASDDDGNPFTQVAIDACTGRLSSRPPVAWGWDLAKKHDWTVGVGLDSEGCVCRFSRWQKIPWKETIARIVKETGRVPALMDSTGVGDPILDTAQRAAPGVFEGFVFTGPSKQMLMEGLAVAIQSQAIQFPDDENATDPAHRLPGCTIKPELETFEYEYTRTGVRYSAPEGLFDDAVCALALAKKKLGETPPPLHWSRTSKEGAEPSGVDSEREREQVAPRRATRLSGSGL
jgi:hypothetical protein